MIGRKELFVFFACFALPSCVAVMPNTKSCSENVGAPTIASLRIILADEVFDEYPNGQVYTIADLERTHHVVYYRCRNEFVIETYPKSFSESGTVVTGGPKFYKVNNDIDKIVGPIGRDA